MSDLPFISQEEWEPNGFIGDPEDGFNYSWILIQESLNFVGQKSTIRNCSLYYSSRKKFIFLVASEFFRPCVWNIKDVTFNYYPESENFLEAKSEANLFHISSVSPSFVKILVKYQKIPLDLVSLPDFEQRLPYENTSAMIPSTKGTSGIGVVAPSPGSLNDSSVMLTESDRNRTRVSGKLTISETAFKVVGDSRVDLKFADMERVQKVTMINSFVVIYMRDGRRFEVAFKDNNEADVELFYQTLEKQTAKQ